MHHVDRSKESRGQFQYILLLVLSQKQIAQRKKS